MLNGAFQMLETGIVPGNRNLDNVEERLKEFQHITYPSRTIRTDGIKSVMLKSFGFGQAGAEILVIHPDYLFAAIETCAYQEYAKRRESRQVHTYRHYHEMLTNTAPLVRVKTAAPYTDAQQSKVYLTPTVRASLKDGKYAYDDASFITQPSATETANISVALQNSFAPLHSEPGVKGVGVDVQLTSVLSLENDVFISRNFTETEIRYCRAAPDPSASFAGRWAAKEAVVKAVGNATDEVVWTRGSGAPLIDIEIQRSDGKAPNVMLRGDAKMAAAKAGVELVKVTISHSESYAIAAAMAI
jgi:fatty acid synthase subunit alpha, fungi type